MKYQRKPLEIEAFQWAGESESQYWPEWFNQAIADNKVTFADVKREGESDDKLESALLIGGGQNVRVALVSNYILLDEKGDISACNVDVFNLNFALVN